MRRFVHLQIPQCCLKIATLRDSYTRNLRRVGLIAAHPDHIGQTAHFPFGLQQIFFCVSDRQA
ncbi:hypothetical protein Z950_348 [Sulfitobacter mediterraneus KCTC 32188]|nr:hypothetical protein Z950_348 [Sulfitobacter mediterraneus KCTC 32188]